MLKIFGTTCNVPVDTVDVTDLLPRSADSSGIVYVKLNRKLECHSSNMFNVLRQIIKVSQRKQPTVLQYCS